MGSHFLLNVTTTYCTQPSSSNDIRTIRETVRETKIVNALFFPSISYVSATLYFFQQVKSVIDPCALEMTSNRVNSILPLRSSSVSFSSLILSNCQSAWRPVVESVVAHRLVGLDPLIVTPFRAWSAYYPQLCRSGPTTFETDRRNASHRRVSFIIALSTFVCVNLSSAALIIRKYLNRSFPVRLSRQTMLSEESKSFARYSANLQNDTISVSVERHSYRSSPANLWQFD